jgi:hypothetical protein
MADDTGTKIAVVASALVALGVVFAALADSPRLCAVGQQKPCTCEDPSASAMQVCMPDGASWGACGPCPTAQASAPAAATEAAAAAPPAAPASAATCNATVGALKVSNRKLTGEAVAAEVGKAEGALETCCQAAPSGSKLPGRAVVRLTVGRDGKVANVLNAGKGAAAALPACALDAFRELDFATSCKPEGAKCNASSTIDVPLTFEAK